MSFHAILLHFAQAVQMSLEFEHSLECVVRLLLDLDSHPWVETTKNKGKDSRTVAFDAIPFCNLSLQFRSN